METKAIRRTPAATRGAISLITLCLISALGVVVASYFSLVVHTQQLGIRQFHNDRAQELAQVGLEEALWALNQNIWTSSGPSSNTAWTVTGANRGVLLNYGSLGHGASGQVSLTVANYASAGPVWPSLTVDAVVTLTDGRVIHKQLQASTTPAPLFGNAIASAEAGVSFDAGGTVDSWNSDPDNNPLTATVGYTFTTGNAANYAAVVAGNTDGLNGVVLTRVQLQGYVATFGQPLAYSLSGVPPGRVLGPATAAGVNVDTARVARSAFVPISPVFALTPPPPAPGNLLSILLGVVGQITAAVGLNLFQIPGDLDIQGTLFKPNLTVNRPMTIIVEGDLDIGGSGKITITPAGSLLLFVDGDVTIGGNGIDNQNNEPGSCAIFCTSTSTSNTLEYNTTRDFCGVIYCENKPIDIRQNATFYGALLSRRQIRFTAGATAPVFHYDTALRTTRFPNVKTPYVIRQLTAP